MYIREKRRKRKKNKVFLEIFSFFAEKYQEFANEVCDKVLAQRGVGILVCGTGVGMSIAANKRKGIRAALCGDTFSARMTRMHNDSNILCLGQRVTGFGLANDIVDAFLNAEFEGGRHERRVNKINEIESLWLSFGA